MNLMKSLAVSVFAAEGVDELADDPICDARELMELIIKPFGKGSEANAKL